MSELPRGLSHAFCNGLERHLLNEELAHVVADDTWVSWQLMVRLRQLTPMPVPEADIELEARALLGERFVGRKETYELFGLVDKSPAVLEGRWKILRMILSRLKGNPLASDVVLLDGSGTTLTKLRKILPRNLFGPHKPWGKEDLWTGETTMGGPMLFMRSIVLERSLTSYRRMLIGIEDIPHVCELAIFNLVTHLLGLPFLTHDDDLVRCRSHSGEQLSIAFNRGLRGRIPREKRELGYLLFYGPKTERDVYFRGCERFQ